ALQSVVAADSKRVDTALTGAEAMVASQRYDEAVKAVAEFRSFADEEPRIAAIINTAYTTHFNRGKAAATDKKWHDAVQEYQKAIDVKPTPEATTALKQAQEEFQSTTNKSAADAALQQSAAFEQDKRYLEAYEVLADLSEAQRALVKDQMQALEPNYVKAASDQAK